jgi:hypothetical protein
MIVVDNMPLSWGHHFESFTVATMTWLTVTQYLWHRRPWLVSLCRNHNPALCSYVTYHWSVDKSYNTVGTGTDYLSGASEFTSVCFVLAQSFVFCVVFCRSLFVLLIFLSFGHCVVCPSIYGFWLPPLLSSKFSYKMSQIAAILRLKKNTLKCNE